MEISYPLKSYLYNNLTYSLIGLREFNNVIEGFLKEEKNKNLLATDNKNLDVISLTQGQYDIDFSNSFPDLLRSSNLINIFSSFEINFKTFSEQILLRSQSPFSLRDLKGNSDFEKIEIVLKKVVKINFSEIENEWDFINHSRLIRNKFVHHKGVMHSSQNDFNKLTKFIDANENYFDKYLESDTYYHIKIKEQFIYQLINIVFSLLEKIAKI